MNHPITEPNYRLNVKKNFKGEIGYEYTVRGDSIEEISQKNSNMKELIKNEVVQ